MHAFFPPRGGATLGAAALAAALLAGCADPRGIVSHARLRDAASVGLAAGSATATPDFLADLAEPTAWWRAYGDPQLDALVAQALAESPSLRQAEARMARAEAVLASARALDGPRVDGSLDVTRQHFSANGIYPPPLGGNTYNLAVGRLTGSWEIDFFGRNRAALQAAVGSVHAATAEAQAARLLLSANLVRAYLQLARQQALLEEAERTLALRTQTLGLVRDRVQAGLDTRLEERQSAGGLPEARREIAAMREQMALTRNAIAALAGRPQMADGIRARPLAQIRALPVPDVLPTDLLGRRPDVAAARWRVEAAAQDVQVARAQFYPNVSLTAFVGLNSLGLRHFLAGDSIEGAFGPAVRLPIFDAGRLRANLATRTADLDAAVESYNATIVDAVHEVADQLTSARAIAQQQAEQRQAEATTRDAYEIARQRYRAGLGTYLNVLTAENAVLLQQRQGIELAARRLDLQAQLVRALGGGYTAGELPGATVAGPAAQPGG